MTLLADLALWNDRRGRFSWLRAITLVALLLPVGVLLFDALNNNLGPRPDTEALHRTGLWTIRFLMITLAITPMRRIARFPQLIDVRRMIGVGTFCYIALHLTLYIVDQSFDLAKVASEIVLRIYLTIGFTAWIGLATLAITSNDYMVRKLGGQRWRKLHWLIYPIALLGIAHYFMQAKLEVFEPTIVAGLYLWLMLYRVLHWTLPRSFLTARGEFPLWVIGALGIVSGFLTLLGEAFGYWLVYGADIGMVLAADFDFSGSYRPGWYVMAAGVIVLAIGAWRLAPVGGWLAKQKPDQTAG